jgi:hypothetical protein
VIIDSNDSLITCADLLSTVLDSKKFIGYIRVISIVLKVELKKYKTSRIRQGIGITRDLRTVTEPIRCQGDRCRMLPP